MRGIALLALLAMIGGPAFSQPFSKTYPSPDGAATAIVTFSAPKNCESLVQIDLGIQKIGFQDYRSESHDDGSCIAQAGWTADSHFFVYSLTSSGGHQSWHASIMAFSRASTRFLDLEDFTKDPITSPDFLLQEPDEIRLETTALPLGDDHQPVRRWLKLGRLGNRSQ